MSTEQNIQDRILVNEKNVLKSDFINFKSKSCTKNKKYKPSCKRGKLCGAKHLAICPETKENMIKGLLLNYKRRDPFFMVDGIIVEEQEIDSVNTNSGVLFEDDLKYLQ